MAVLDRERWFRSFSWKMITALFMFGVLGMMFFILWGGDQAFLASIFFIAGGASFYLLVQAMASWRSRHDQKGPDGNPETLPGRAGGAAKGKSESNPGLPTGQVSVEAAQRAAELFQAGGRCLQPPAKR